MTGRKKARGPRKTIPNQGSSKAAFLIEEDWEIALGVCQVVKDLVCQVAETPYGELKRKRPPFFNVMRKFVKDSVQSYQDAETTELPPCITKKNKNDEQESPYGIELVWGIVLAELEKIEKKERARVYSSQKAARQKEKKKQEALEAARAYLEQWKTMKSESDSSEDEPRRKIPTCKLATPQRREADPLFDPASVSSPSSRFSDESDWAVRPHSSRKTRPESDVAPFVAYLTRLTSELESSRSLTDQSKPESNYPIFNQVRRGRGRGRGKGVRPPTVRSILNAQMGEELVDQSSPLHPCVSLTPPGQSTRAEPEFDFGKSTEVNEKKLPIKEPSTMRRRRGSGKRGRGGRGRGGVMNPSDRSLDEGYLEWEKDQKEMEQQILLAESIETSGESSQESHEHMANTIDEVVKRVNGMSELDRRGRGMRRKKENEDETEKRPKASRIHSAKKSSKTDCVKRQSSMSSLEEASTSGVKRRKEGGDGEVIIIDSDNMESEEDSLFASLTSPSLSPHLRQSNVEDNDESDSDVLILD